MKQLPLQDGGADAGSQAAFDSVQSAPPLVVAQVGGPYAGNEGATITLSGSNSFAVGGAVVLYEWDLDNDGQFDDSTGVSSNVTFGDNGAFTVGLRVTDNTGHTDTDTSKVTVNNTTPVVNAGPDATVILGNPFVSAGSFTDPGADTWTATVNYGDGAGAQPLVLGPDKTFALNHKYAHSGSYTITVTITDDDAGIGAAMVLINVPNTIPAPVDDAYAVNEDSILVVNAPGVLGNDSDAEGNLLTAVLVGGTLHGTLALHADGSFAYEPDPDFYGTDNFTYRANDGIVNSTAATVTITVNAVNDAPVANDDFFWLEEDYPYYSNVLNNDNEADGEPLTAVLVNGPTHGTVEFYPNGTVVYAPKSDYFGLDSFTYQINDGTFTSNVASVSLNIESSDDPPVAKDDTYTMNKNGVLTVAAADGLLANDIDIDSSNFLAEVFDSPTHGSLSWDSDGSFIYTPNLDFEGTDSFRYVAYNQSSNNFATVNITVTPANNAPPVAVADNYNLDEDAILVVATASSVLGNDNDSNPLTALLVSSPLHGTLTLNADGSFRYVPGGDLHGTESFTYRAFDGELYSEPATVRLTITEVNDAPAAGADTTSVIEDGTVTIGVLTNDSTGPANESAQTLAVTAASALHGIVLINANGTLRYTPAVNYNGPDTISYTIRDNGTTKGAANPLTATGSVAVTITELNDAPTTGADTATVAEDSNVTIAALANDSTGPSNESTQMLSITVASALHGTVLINPNGTLRYTPTANYNGPDKISYTIRDSGTTNGAANPLSATGSVAVTVTEVNDAPTTGADSASVAEDSSVTITVVANDSTGVLNECAQTLTVTVASALHGTVLINANRTLRYTPAANFNGTDTISYTIRDNGTTNGAANPLSTTGSVDVTITEVNDAPTTGADTVTVDEDSNVTITVLTNDSTGPSNEGTQTLTVTAASALHGSVLINANGTLRYTPTADYNGPDTISYTIRDNGTTKGAANPLTAGGLVSVTVTPVDEPTAIRGNSFTDLSGNGLTTDDTALAGMTIKLYRDSNRNGVLDIGKDTYVASTITTANGSYAFPAFGNGTYFVNESVSANYVRTYPLLSDTHTVQVSAGTQATAVNFANFQKCDKNAVSGYHYVINGTRTVSDLTGNVDEGDTVRVVFTIASNRSNVPLSLVSYKTPEDVYHAETAYLQQIVNLDKGFFTGSGSLTVKVPQSFYQIDFVCGAAIDHFGPANSNVFYSAQNRLFDADNGGTPSGLTGFVYRDDNNNGVKASGEPGISNVKVTLTGTDDLNRTINRSVTTSSSGAYNFGTLRPGTYQIQETQPTNYNDGKENLGTTSGIKDNDIFSNIVLGARVIGNNYNFGELKKNQNLVVAAASAGQADSSDSDAHAELLSQTLVVGIGNPQSRLDSAQRARIADGVAELNFALASQGIAITLTANAEILADVYLTFADSSPCGAAADGVLGCATSDGGITLIDGWNWYAGADAGAIGSGQYDFQTIVTHELAHRFGLGHSPDVGSVMYEALAAGVARRSLTANDLNEFALVDDEEEASEPVLASPPNKSERVSPIQLETVHLTPGWDQAIVIPARNNPCEFRSDVLQSDSLRHSGDNPSGATGARGDVLVGGEGSGLRVGAAGHDLMIGGFGDGQHSTDLVDLALESVLQEFVY